MTQASTNSTFFNTALANVSGVDTIAGETLTVEFLTADPSLTSGIARIWVNTTTGLMKFTADGVTTKTITAT